MVLGASIAAIIIDTLFRREGTSDYTAGKYLLYSLVNKYIFDYQQVLTVAAAASGEF